MNLECCARASDHLGVDPLHVVGDVCVDSGQLGAGAGDTPGHQAYQGSLPLLKCGYIKERKQASIVLFFRMMLVGDDLETVPPPY